MKTLLNKTILTLLFTMTITGHTQTITNVFAAGAVSEQVEQKNKVIQGCGCLAAIYLTWLSTYSFAAANPNIIEGCGYLAASYLIWSATK